MLLLEHLNMEQCHVRTHYDIVNERTKMLYNIFECQYQSLVSFPRIMQHYKGPLMISLCQPPLDLCHILAATNEGFGYVHICEK